MRGWLLPSLMGLAILATAAVAGDVVERPADDYSPRRVGEMEIAAFPGCDKTYDAALVALVDKKSGTAQFGLRVTAHDLYSPGRIEEVDERGGRPLSGTERSDSFDCQHACKNDSTWVHGWISAEEFAAEIGPSALDLRVRTTNGADCDGYVTVQHDDAAKLISWAASVAH